MTLKVKRLEPAAKLPSYAHPGDAGLDFYALEHIAIAPNERVAVRTGIALEIPDGHVGLFWDKSGVAIREGMKLLGGVIDAGYRGEILIGMVNLGDKEYVFDPGHKVAQLLIQRVEVVEVVEEEELGDTKRGKGGFGSTGK